ncbi:MAG: ISL3 family transposase [Rhodoferax sp.]|uniref:ISL3 family transposase n=1 Tax=Rhodoferax sp. TaxID=50421 RepID=UPI0013FEE361|nr:ISL3 family transposase [Rhodoferax sp.]NDP41067.1 ISL3 family transposase [Rhodoferax sp.]
MPANILNLPDYKVVRVDENDHDYHISAEASNPPTICSGCGSTRLIGHGRNEQVIRDMPTHGKRVAIYVDTRRWRCVDCGKTFMEVLPSVNAKREMTERLTRWIGQQSLKRTFASIAEETGLDEKTIRNIFRDYVAVLEAEFRFETPKWMGIDEIHLIKPRGVITNIENNTVLDLLVNRNQDTIAKYLTGLKGKEKIQYVAMDMWRPYKNAVNAVLPQAIVVIDKFHIVKMANGAMEKVRKSMRADLTIKQKRGLMHDRFVLLKRERDLTDKEQFNLDGWVKNYPLLGEAYRLKETFYGIYDAKSQPDALLAYKSWQKSIPPELHDHFHDLTRAFQNWMPDILNYFKHPVTNAYTESLNSLIRVMDRMGRGYSFEALRAKILFTEGAHKRTLSRPKFERRREPEPVEMGLGLPEDAIGFGLPPVLMRKTVITPRKNTPNASPPHETLGPPKNYGADINTLIELLEAGKL